ncbi:MAG: ABC transporter permease [Solirubrobacteraceae bacterium]|nr:ABC transporter permease [Solirubrobacteraceae bacterium]
MVVTGPEVVDAPSADSREALPAVAPLHEIEGPTALGGSLRRFAYLTFTIATTEFRLRFYGSVLGYFWQLFRPLLLFATLYVVFTHMVKVGGAVPHYPAILLMNIVLFTFFGEGASAVTSVVDREQLVRKIQVPRLAIPLAVTVTALFNLALNLLVVLLFVLANGNPVRLSWLEIPVLVGALTFLAAGFAMLVSALYVRYRDVKPIWDVFMQVLFYATPVIYVLDGVDAFSDRFKEYLAMNPVATVLIQMRHSVVDPSAPSAADAVGGAIWLLVPIGIALFVIVLGYRTFNREAPRIAEEL